MNLKISYEKGWDSICIHVDIPVPYEENYQMRMIRNNTIPHLSDTAEAEETGQADIPSGRKAEN